jgi:hypothetical protein
LLPNRGKEYVDDPEEKHKHRGSEANEEAKDEGATRGHGDHGTPL